MIYTITIIFIVLQSQSLRRTRIFPRLTDVVIGLTNFPLVPTIARLYSTSSRRRASRKRIGKRRGLISRKSGVRCPVGRRLRPLPFLTPSFDSETKSLLSRIEIHLEFIESRVELMFLVFRIIYSEKFDL